MHVDTMAENGKRKHDGSGVEQPTKKAAVDVDIVHKKAVMHKDLLRQTSVQVSLNETDDVRIDSIGPLIPPQILMEDVPLTEAATQVVERNRREIAAILDGIDDRLIVVVGPCSIHDVDAALEYARLLKKEADRYKEDLLIIMRVYFEKPRTTVGWKGLINDPNLDGTFKINVGLKVARKLLVDVNELGIGCAVEFLDTLTPQFIGDLVAWGAIGARTTESQVHRELASGLSCPVGFKNGTEGSVQVAVDAVKASRSAHRFLSVTKQGLAAIVTTKGNPYCHVILRGGASGPNYERTHIEAALERLAASKVRSSIMVDCSHGNSRKQHKNQAKVSHDVALQIADGNKSLIGLMIESNLKEGRQDIPAEGPSGLKYGVSITDACVSFEDTIPMLEELAHAVQTRRARS
eukprot:Colp12_sorted_trinity150504_noHs@31154